MTLTLYLFERKRELEAIEREREEREWEAWRSRVYNRELAYMITMADRGMELPVIPPPGGKLSEPPTVQIVVDGKTRTVPAPPPGCVYDGAGKLHGRVPARQGQGETCDPHVFVDGQCRGCDLRNGDGVLRYGADPVRCEAHEVENGVCRKCGGREMREGWVTQATPRILGRCEHARHEPTPGGSLKCLDCGSVGN